MTLIEAIKTGKPMRLPHWAEDNYIDCLLQSGNIHYYYCWEDMSPRGDFSIAEILSNEWELKGDKKRTNKLTLV